MGRGELTALSRLLGSVTCAVLSTPRLTIIIITRVAYIDYFDILSSMSPFIMRVLHFLTFHPYSLLPSLSPAFVLLDIDMTLYVNLCHTLPYFLPSICIVLDM